MPKGMCIGCHGIKFYCTWKGQETKARQSFILTFFQLHTYQKACGSRPCDTLEKIVKPKLKFHHLLTMTCFETCIRLLGLGDHLHTHTQSYSACKTS